MNIAKSLAVGAAMLGTLFMGACGSSHHHHESQYVSSYDVVCDHHEYLIHDYHCGYTDHGHWVYFVWASPNGVSRAPSNWTPPASVRSKYTVRQVPNPKYTSSTKKRVTNPGVTNNRTNTNRVVKPQSQPKPKVVNPGYRAPSVKR